MTGDRVPSRPRCEGPPLGPAHKIVLRGLCSINGGDDLPCSASEIAADSAVIRSEASVAFADDVILSMPHIGLLKAVVARTFEGGFEITFEPAPLSKLGLYLDWLNGRPQHDDHADARHCERIVPIRRLVPLERAGEPQSIARIIDLSRSGVAFTTTKALMGGETVKVGSQSGRVVRIFDGGAAAIFDQLISEEDFGVMLDLNRAEHDPWRLSPSTAPEPLRD